MEVDALPANDIRERLRVAIETHINKREWEALQAQETREQKDIFRLVKRLDKNRAA